MRAATEVYLLSLTAALYLLRGMLEFPAIGWRFEAKLTTAIGVAVLPALAGVAAANVAWEQWLIVPLSALGVVINVVLLIRLWRGLTPVAALTAVISTTYLAVAFLALGN